MSILKRQVNSDFSNFASFFILNFKLIHFLLWIKGSHQSPNFEMFKCCVKNLPYSSCHFPNHKPVFLQTLHHSSVSWKIIPQYLFRSNVIYFTQMEPVRVRILRIWGGRSKSTKFLSFLKQKISFSSNFASLFSVMRHKSSILFLGEILYNFNKRSLSKYEFREFSRDQSKVWNFALWWVPFVQII